MSVLNFDTGVQSLLEILQNARDHFCSNFVPCLLQSAFQGFNGLVIWRIREPNVLRPESRKVCLTPFDRLLGAVGRGPAAKASKGPVGLRPARPLEDACLDACPNKNCVLGTLQGVSNRSKNEHKRNYQGHATTSLGIEVLSLKLCLRNPSFHSTSLEPKNPKQAFQNVL
ncbi:hypothetical protein L596_022627 [Steinernema carpocapsae]|uniref:Uncharacterized protein n=1 Tax=Steinernema carpocapsae TaxID=34508 RepID=A0A4V6A095_STECR|nr:hypothetical protein L596_022627 [Steinernema carpocapsae]